MLIEFTEKAIEAVETYKKQLSIAEDQYLRVGIRQKNAQDKGLLIGFDSPGAKDKTTSIQGLNVVYNPGQVFFFAGMVIDFSEQNGRKGFTFIEKNKLTK
ncbi:MAG: hypothetical protein LCH37_03630 [Bacteroidetes bacterium]|nr:hypothetical protein [Bacteroidota bacterium]MCK6610124.1 hypothetical protein [Bacteroidia bacterium]